MTGTESPACQFKGIRKLTMDLTKPTPFPIVEMHPRQEHSGSGTAEHDVRLPKDHSASHQPTKNGQKSRSQHIDSERVGGLCLIMVFCKPPDKLPLFQLCQQRVEPRNLTICF